MDLSWLERTELLIGKESVERLTSRNVLIVGLGGVGSFAAEFVARAGIGNLTIIDGDVVDKTNKNRQLPALTSTVGLKKADLMAARIRDINPDVNLRVIDSFQRPEHTQELVRHEKFDYVMDCIDSVTPKVYLIRSCVENGQRLISSMGAGGKLDASLVDVTDIGKTYNCFKAVFNKGELCRDSVRLTDGSNFKKSFYGTISYMPALFGLRMAAEVIEDLR
jgi:tRNA threonylcarbamoyladenosine dehydratase